MKLRYLLLTLLTVVHWSHADEHTVRLETFQQEVSLEAYTVPIQTHEVTLSPKQWDRFRLQWIVAHGESVKKGDQIAVFDKRAYQQALQEAEARHQLSEVELRAQRAEKKYEEKRAKLQKLEIAQRQRRAQEDHDYFFQVTQKEKTEAAQFDLKKAQQYLLYQKEEYEQLLQMYREDDLTEQTEEIILVRAKNRMEEYERAVKTAKTQRDYVIETELKREAKDHRDRLVTQQLELTYELEELELNLQKKKTQLVQAEEQHAQSAKKLEELKEDGAWLSYHAPVDGIVYYGLFENGRWSEAGTERFLKQGHSLPLHQVVLTIVPENAVYELVGHTSEEVVRQLEQVEGATCWWAEDSWRPQSVAKKSVAFQKDKEGKLRVHFTWDKATDATLKPMNPRQKAEVRALCYQAEEVVAIPVTHLIKTAEGHVQVKLKMAEGDFQMRAVEVGRVSETQAEILSGLEPGQVIQK